MEYQTVGEFTRYLKLMFDTSSKMRNVYLKGEISNLKIHSTGHMYFSLKDETSKINAIMFSTSCKKLDFVPKEGTKVLVHGRVSIYEATGNYQIYVDKMEEDGLGNLYIEFEKLKKKLSEEGLFKEEHKRKIPKYPKKIGVVTASTGAAIKDIISTIKRRYPIANVYLYSSLVQGDGAKEDIVRNIKRAGEDDLDVLIVGRGGGSIEDLWPFNEEIVADAIYNSKKPIISAIGHETDFTISDFVADVRAATPSNAGEIVVKDSRVLKNNLDTFTLRLKQSYYNNLQNLKTKLSNILSTRIYKDDSYLLSTMYQNLLGLTEKLELLSPKEVILKNIERNNTHLKHLYNAFKSYLADKSNYYLVLNEKLNLLNPLSVLNKGYSITFKDDVIVKDSKTLTEGDIIKTKFKDGEVLSKVIKE